MTYTKIQPTNYEGIASYHDYFAHTDG